jgi:hypothetical protein
MLNGASGPIVLLLALPNKKRTLNYKNRVDNGQDGRLSPVLQSILISTPRTSFTASYVTNAIAMEGTT